MPLLMEFIRNRGRITGERIEEIVTREPEREITPTITTAQQQAVAQERLQLTAGNAIAAELTQEIRNLNSTIQRLVDEAAEEGVSVGGLIGAIATDIELIKTRLGITTAAGAGGGVTRRIIGGASNLGRTALGYTTFPSNLGGIDVQFAGYKLGRITGKDYGPETASVVELARSGQPKGGIQQWSGRYGAGDVNISFTINVPESANIDEVRAAAEEGLDNALVAHRQRTGQ